jgi:N-acyl-D-amino-acid deacylase
MSEDDVQYALRQPWISIGADSGAPTAAARARGSAVHPRAYGTFPRVLGHYSRELKLMSLEEAVRRMTSQAALRANLTDRGILRAGMKADSAVFDPAEIRDESKFDDPHHFSVGVSHVVVNGVPVLRDGVMTGALPGKSIRGKGFPRQRREER